MIYSFCCCIPVILSLFSNQFSGVIGAVLPLTIALSMYANIDAGFGGAEHSAAASGQPPSTMLWVMGKVRLTLEWLVVPLFITSLQLPQGGLCYWATSSIYALAQNHILKLPAARQALGLPNRAGALMPPPRATSTSSSASSQAALDSSTQSSTNTGLIAGNGSTSTAFSADVIPDDVAEEFTRAAELRATGDFAGAAKALEKVLELYPEQSRALFALGQVRSGLKEWGGASHAYLQAAKCETEPGQACRAWFGAGVALHMQGREDDAVETFTRAAGPDAGEQLRVRAWVAGATIEEKLGRREAAVELLRKAAKFEPKVEEIYIKPLLEGKMGAGKAE